MIQEMKKETRMTRLKIYLVSTEIKQEQEEQTIAETCSGDIILKKDFDTDQGPLSKESFLQAFEHLLQTSDFRKQIYESYVLTYKATH